MATPTIIINVGGYRRRAKSGKVTRVKPHKRRKKWHVSYKVKDKNKIIHDVKEYSSKETAQKFAKQQKKQVTEKYGKNQTLITPIEVINKKFAKRRG
jgi:Uri superfamily endonuclease